MADITIHSHDTHPAAESAAVDTGLGASNDAAAPLHEVRPLACFALGEGGAVVGGAVGRRWGRCCELQQLWVEPARRHEGIATRLVAAFEQRARAHGCDSVFLETFSFQAPGFYRAVGYRVVHENTLFPHGIVKFLMVRQWAADDPAA